jgi:hypothetical protein
LNEERVSYLVRILSLNDVMKFEEARHLYWWDALAGFERKLMECL